MAVVPDDPVGTVQEEAIPGRAYPRFSDDANPAEFGAGVGSALERLGAQQQASQKQAQAKAQGDANRVRIAQANTDLSSYADDLQHTGVDPNLNGADAAFRQTGPDAVNMGARYGPMLDAKAQSIMSTLTPDQQGAFAERVAQVKDSFHLNLDRYEFEQGNREAVQTFGNAKDQAIKSATLNYRDDVDSPDHPSATTQARDDIYNAAMALAARGGKAAMEAYKQTGYDKDLSQLHDSVIDAHLADGDVEGARQHLATWKSDLSGQDQLRETLKIAEASKQQQNEANADYLRRFQTTKTGYENGLQGAPLISDDEIRQHSKTPDEDIAAIHTLRNASAAAGVYSKMPTEAIVADVNSHQPTGLSTTSESDLEGARVRMMAADRIIKARQSDPAGFAIQNGDWSPLDTSKPANTYQGLAQRAATQSDLSQRYGVPVPILSNSEAKQFSQQFASQPWQGKLQTLQTLRSAMPTDQAYGTLLGQLGQGHTPSTAIAGSKLDVPKPGQEPVWYDDRHGVTQESGQAAGLILRGHDLLAAPDNEKGATSKFPMPEGAGKQQLEQTFTQAIGGANSDLFRSRGQSQDAYHTAYLEAYAALASDRGKANGVFDAQTAKDAAKAVIGNQTTYLNSTVVPPSGMDPTRFQSLMDGAVEASAKGAGYDMRGFRPYGVRELGDTVGTGRYALIDASGNTIRSKDDQNKAIIVDLNHQYLHPTTTEEQVPVPAMQTPRTFGRGMAPRAVAPQQTVGRPVVHPTAEPVSEVAGGT